MTFTFHKDISGLQYINTEISPRKTHLDRKIHRQIDGETEDRGAFPYTSTHPIRRRQYKDICKMKSKAQITWKFHHTNCTAFYSSLINKTIILPLHFTRILTVYLHLFPASSQDASGKRSRVMFPLIWEVHSHSKHVEPKRVTETSPLYLSDAP